MPAPLLPTMTEAPPAGEAANGAINTRWLRTNLPLDPSFFEASWADVPSWITARATR